MGCSSTDAGGDSYVTYDVPAAVQGATAEWDKPADAPVAAPKERATRITVLEAVDEAIRNNRLVMQSRINAAIAMTNQQLARSAMIPQISANYEYRYVKDIQEIIIPGQGSFALLPHNTNVWGFSMDFPIFSFGRHWYNYQASRLAQRSSEAQRAAAESNIAAAVTASAFDVLEGIASIEVALANEKALGQQVKDSTALFEAGSVTKVAVLEASVEYDAAVRERERLESLVPILKMRLNVVLGRPANGAIEVEDDRTTRPPVWEADVLEEEAVARRPELRAARLDAAATQRALRSQFGAEIGEVRGLLNWENTDNPIVDPQEVLSFVLAYSLPIFTGGARPARIRRAQHEVELAEIRLRDLEENIRTEVADAHRAVVESFKDIAVADLAVERSNESLRIQREKYKNGRATNRELLDTTSLLTNSRIAAVNAIYSYKVALRELARARGADPSEPPFQDVDRRIAAAKKKHS